MPIKQLQLNLGVVARQKFDGETYDHQKDCNRLTSQLERVKAFMSDGEWRTLKQIAKATKASEAAASARLRDLRKERFGAYTVERSLGDPPHKYKVKE